ncbi:MAG: hypothetical protein AAB214_11885 [Fibrobacterota bacterium]
MIGQILLAAILQLSGGDRTETLARSARGLNPYDPGVGYFHLMIPAVEVGVTSNSWNTALDLDAIALNVNGSDKSRICRHFGLVGTAGYRISTDERSGPKFGIGIMLARVLTSQFVTVLTHDGWKQNVSVTLLVGWRGDVRHIPRTPPE